MALITVVASSVTGTSRNMPPNLPTGVRSGSQMRASRIRPAYPDDVFDPLLGDGAAAGARR